MMFPIPTRKYFSGSGLHGRCLICGGVTHDDADCPELIDEETLSQSKSVSTKDHSENNYWYFMKVEADRILRQADDHSCTWEEEELAEEVIMFRSKLKHNYLLRKLSYDMKEASANQVIKCLWKINPE